MGVAAPVKGLARTGVRTWGAATSSQRPLPDFLIIGAKRSGTTTLFRSLQSHPDVLGLFPASQDKKSPHYFDLDYQQGERWYRSFFPTERERRKPDGTERISGEASPYYLFHPLAPARIAAAVPDARLVVLLRNPVDRAFSHHWDRVKNGIEDLSFEEAIAAEDERLAGEQERLVQDAAYRSHAYEHFSYVRRGRYAEQLERVFAGTPRGRVLVLRSEDLYAEPQAAFDEALAFLGLAPHRPERFEKLHGHADRPTVDPATRARLDEVFAPHNRALADLLGTEVWW